MKKSWKWRLTAPIILFCGMLLFSCDKESSNLKDGKLQISEERAGSNPEIAESQTTYGLLGNTEYSKRKIEFDHNQGYYTASMATSDFGNLSSWPPQGRMYITEFETARVKLLPNKLSGAGGIVSKIDIKKGTHYVLKFRMKFKSDFNWGRGGKVGLGFLIGEGNTGGNKSDGNGGSVRLMWHNLNDRQTLRPYVYYTDMPGQFGDDFGKRFPSSGSLEKNKWYSVRMEVKSNSGSQENGFLKIEIDDEVVISKNDIRWTTNDAMREINRIDFATFRGGSQEHWKVSTTDYIYIDDVWWNRRATD